MSFVASCYFIMALIAGSLAKFCASTHQQFVGFCLVAGVTLLSGIAMLSADYVKRDRG